MALCFSLIIDGRGLYFDAKVISDMPGIILPFDEVCTVDNLEGALRILKLDLGFKKS